MKVKKRFGDPPDLDDVRDEDMAFTVADAPSVAVNRYRTVLRNDVWVAITTEITSLKPLTILTF